MIPLWSGFEITKAGRRVVLAKHPLILRGNFFRPAFMVQPAEYMQFVALNPCAPSRILIKPSPDVSG